MPTSFRCRDGPGVLFVFCAAFSRPLRFVAQTFAQRPADKATAATTTELQALSKKIDEQNAKIDMLSQQILKLEQQLANTRPGVMIGEATLSSATTAAPAVETTKKRRRRQYSHGRSRQKHSTSIAKMHNVTVSELQKLNHIENDRKLQIGQTIILPGPGCDLDAVPSLTSAMENATAQCWFLRKQDRQHHLRPRFPSSNWLTGRAMRRSRRTIPSHNLTK